MPGHGVWMHMPELQEESVKESVHLNQEDVAVCEEGRRAYQVPKGKGIVLYFIRAPSSQTPLAVQFLLLFFFSRK
jgi:hypothetical protein